MSYYVGWRNANPLMEKKGSKKETNKMLITKILKPEILTARTLAELDFQCNAEELLSDLDEDSQKIFVDNQQRLLDALVAAKILG